MRSFIAQIDGVEGPIKVDDFPWTMAEFHAWYNDPRPECLIVELEDGSQMLIPAYRIAYAIIKEEPPTLRVLKADTTIA